MVREALGEDAIIVATREEKGGKGGVRVTAAVEPQAFQDDFDPMDPARGWIHGDDIDEETAVQEKLTDVMLRHGVPEEVTDQVISCAMVAGFEQADVALTAALEHLFSFRPISQRKQSNAATMLVGPPGAGKTLVVAKLAARAVMDGLRVGVISTDIVRAGGVEQLSAFTKLMDVELKKAGNAKQLQACLDYFRGADLVFVDTAGLNPFDPEEMRHLARLISAGTIDPVLALPAGTDAEECGEIARVYATLGVASMVPTRIDIARRLGGLLSAAHHGGLIFAEAGHTPKIAEGLTALSPQRLAGLLMPESVKKRQKIQAPSGRRQMVEAG